MSAKANFRLAVRSVKRLLLYIGRFMIGTLRWFFRRKLFFFIFAIILMAIYFVLPSNQEIRLFVSDEIPEEHTNGAIQDTRLSLNEARARERIFSQLSSNILQHENPRPRAEERIGTDRLEDFVSSTLELKNETDWLKVEVGIGVIDLIQAYIDEYSSDRAYNVIVSEYIPPSTEGASHYTFAANLHRRDASFTSVDVLPDRSGLVEVASKFFLREVFEASYDCSKRMCASQYSYSDGSLSKLASIWDALKVGHSVGFCRDVKTTSNCIDNVREEMAEFDSKYGNAGFTDFTALIAEMVALKGILDGGLASPGITTALDRMNDKFLQVSAREDAFSLQLEDDGRLEIILAEQGLDELQLSSEFLSTYSHFRTARGMVHRAKFADAQKEYSKVTGAPDWFEKLMSRYQLYVTVELNVEDFESVVKKIERLSADTDRSNGIEAGFLAIISSIFFEKNDEVFDSASRAEFQGNLDDLWTRVFEIQRGENDPLGAKLEYARFLHFSGRKDEASTHLKEAEAVLRQAKDKSNLVTSLVSAAMFASKREDASSAFEFGEAAIKVRPSNVCAFRNHEDFEFAREHDPDGFIQMVNSDTRVNNVPC